MRRIRRIVVFTVVVPLTLTGIPLPAHATSSEKTPPLTFNGRLMSEPLHGRAAADAPFPLSTLWQQADGQISGASIAEGQEAAGSFDELRSRVSLGNDVIVVDAKGREVRGTITDLSALSLVLAVGTDRMEFLEADVETVSKRDSRWNGTLIGLAAGAALGALIDHGLVEEYGREDIQVGESAEFIAFAAGIGGGIGFAVDALTEGRRVIYSRPPTRTKAGVSPIWGPLRRGIVVSLTF